MNKGIFIAIEGGDGLGKSTLVNNLKKKFENAVFSFEPGGTDFGKKVRNLIMESGDISFGAEMYLFCASRAEFVNKIVKPNLDKNKMVISDRFVYSSLVYQGVVGGIGVDEVLEANKIALSGTVPDLVICLCGQKSFRQEVVNRFDKQTDSRAKQINEGFKNLALKFDYFKVVDVTNLTEMQVFEEALKLINEVIEKKENNG